MGELSASFAAPKLLISKTHSVLQQVMPVFISRKLGPPLPDPSIAQLVERWTVVVLLSSIGHWFESGSKDF